MLNKIILIFSAILLLLAWVGGPGILICPYKWLTGKPCLFCGTLTSLTLVMHGNIKTAWELNPVGVIAFLFLMMVFAKSLFAIIVHENTEKNSR